MYKMALTLLQLKEKEILKKAKEEQEKKKQEAKDLEAANYGPRPDLAEKTENNEGDSDQTADSDTGME